MHKLESIQENVKHRIFQDLEIQTDHLLQTKRPDLQVIVNKKKNYQIMDVVISADHKNEKKKNKKKKQVLGPGQKTKKKLWNVKLMVIKVVTVTHLEQSPKAGQDD